MRRPGTRQLCEQRCGTADTTRKVRRGMHKTKKHNNQPVEEQKKYSITTAYRTYLQITGHYVRITVPGFSGTAPKESNRKN